jgi:ketosteroid isomerase-like protein
MERSEEVRQALLRYYERISAKDAAAFDELVSDDPATMVVGTAPGEVVRERHRLRYGFEAEGVTLRAGQPEAYAEGTLGWAIDEPVFAFPGGAEVGIRIRLTTVWHREGERWRLVHGHFSVGVPDDEVVELQRRWSRG